MDDRQRKRMHLRRLALAGCCGVICLADVAAPIRLTAQDYLLPAADNAIDAAPVVARISLPTPIEFSPVEFSASPSAGEVPASESQVNATGIHEGLTPIRVDRRRLQPVESFALPQRAVTPNSGVPFVRSLADAFVRSPAGVRASEAEQIEAENEYRLKSLAASQGLWSPPIAEDHNESPSAVKDTVPTFAPEKSVAQSDPPTAQFFSLPTTSNPFEPKTGASDESRPVVAAQVPPVGRSIANVAETVVASPTYSMVGSLTGDLHTAQLKTIAGQALVAANESLRKRSVYSAQSSAMQALHSVVSARDAAANTNVNAERLQVALDAIREAQDFCGRYGMLENDAVRRMIESHATDVLRGQDLSQISAIKAVEAYLTVGKNNIVAAAGGSPEASEALRLLGRVQQQLGGDTSIYNQAVALTWLQAAVEARPNNAVAYRDLGQSLLSQGLPEQASQALKKSVELLPTRGAMEDLLSAAKRTGDQSSVRQCEAMLASDSLPNDFPILKLSPEQFAMTSQKQSTATTSVSTAARIAAQAGDEGLGNETDDASTKHWFQFWRR